MSDPLSSVLNPLQKTPESPNHLVETERQFFEERMLLMNIMAAPFRLLNHGLEKAQPLLKHSFKHLVLPPPLNMVRIKDIEQGVRKACTIHPTAQSFCNDAKRSFQEAIDHGLRPLSDKISSTNREWAEGFAHRLSKRGISRQEALHAFDSFEIVSSEFALMALGSAPTGIVHATKKAMHAKKSSSLVARPLSTSEKKITSYLDSRFSFASPPKEFKGLLKRDLVVVQYRGPGNSYHWWTVPAEANRFSTVEDALERLALLSKFGKRTHVAAAIIPKNTPIRFLHGRAKPMRDLKRLQFRRGGAVQYRFLDFDPKWIRSIRPLPPSRNRLFPTPLRHLRSLGAPGIRTAQIFRRQLVLNLSHSDRLDSTDKQQSKHSEHQATPQKETQPREHSEDFEFVLDEEEIQSDDSSAQPPFTSDFHVQPNIQNPSQSEVSHAIHLGNHTQISTNIVPANLAKSTIAVTNYATNRLSTSVFFTPQSLRSTILSGSYVFKDVVVGAQIPLLSPKNCQISIGGNLSQNLSAHAQIVPNNLLKSRIGFGVITTISGIPAQVSVDMRVLQPENAKISVGIPLPGRTINLFTLDLRKKRKQLRHIGNKFAKKLGLGKKIFGRNKNKHNSALQKQKAIETFLALQNCMQQIDTLSCYQTPELTHAIGELNQEIGVLLGEINHFPPIEDLDISDSSFSQVFDELSVVFDQIEGFVQGRITLNSTLSALAKGSQKLGDQLNELEDTLDTVDESLNTTAQLLYEQQTLSTELETATQDLIENSDQVVNWLKSTVSQSTLESVIQSLSTITE